MAKKSANLPVISTPETTHAHPYKTNSRIVSLKKINLLKRNKRTGFTSSIVGQLVFNQKVDISKLSKGWAVENET